MAVAMEDRVLAASQQCIGVLLSTENASVGIDEVCSRTGLSVRTFHRYFTTRAQMIRPALTDMTRRFDDAVAMADGDLSARVAAAFAGEVVAPSEIDVVRLVGVLRRRHDLWATYLEAIEFGESHLAKVLGQIDVSLDFCESRVAAAAIVASSRLAVEAAADGADPVEAFGTCISLFGIGASARRRHQT